MRPPYDNNRRSSYNHGSMPRSRSGPRSRTSPRSGSGNTYDSHGPGVRLRGNARQLYDRYTQMARDLRAASDHMGAERLLQYAEHYYRIFSASADLPDEGILEATRESAARKAEATTFEDDDSKFDLPTDLDSADLDPGLATDANINDDVNDNSTSGTEGHTEIPSVPKG